MPEEIVMRDSPEAASLATVTGWVSRDGRFYGGDERMARFAGCTHAPCDECGEPVKKPWVKCDSCRAAIEKAKFDAMPRAEWDGIAMIYSMALDEYYESPDYALEELEDGDDAADCKTLADMALVICQPNYVRQLDPCNYCSDDLPEDVDEPPLEVIEAINAFNKAVDGIILSWSPGKYALALPS